MNDFRTPPKFPDEEKNTTEFKLINLLLDSEKDKDIIDFLNLNTGCDDPVTKVKNSIRKLMRIEDVLFDTIILERDLDDTKNQQDS